jgi:hypothetical protein
MTICFNKGVTMAKEYNKGELGGEKIRIIDKQNHDGI